MANLWLFASTAKEQDGQVVGRRLVLSELVNDGSGMDSERFSREYRLPIRGVAKSGECELRFISDGIDRDALSSISLEIDRVRYWFFWKDEQKWGIDELFLWLHDNGKYFPLVMERKNIEFGSGPKTLSPAPGESQGNCVAEWRELVVVFCTDESLFSGTGDAFRFVMHASMDDSGNDKRNEKGASVLLRSQPYRPGCSYIERISLLKGSFYKLHKWMSKNGSVTFKFGVVPCGSDKFGIANIFVFALTELGGFPIGGRCGVTEALSQKPSEGVQYLNIPGRAWPG